jgi:SpoVK/Ycf46/Vps4 family AAA+-type ATPase
MLDIYLSKRPVADDLDLEALAKRLEGYSGADIKYLCDRAATIPFLQSVASGQDGDITAAVIDDALAGTKPSVTAEMLHRFDQWGQAAARD